MGARSLASYGELRVNVPVQPPTSDWFWTTLASVVGFLTIGLASLIGWAFRIHTKNTFAPLLTQEEKEKEIKSICDDLYTSRAEYHEIVKLIQGLTIQSALMAQQLTGLGKLAEQQQETAKETNQHLGVLSVDVASIRATWDTAWELKHGAPPPPQAHQRKSTEQAPPEPSSLAKFWRFDVPGAEP